MRGQPSSSVEPAFEGIQNPLDALRLLAEAASENRDEIVSSADSNMNTRHASVSEAAHDDGISTTHGHAEATSRTAMLSGLQLYEPVASGTLDPTMIGTLLER